MAMYTAYLKNLPARWKSVFHRKYGMARPEPDTIEAAAEMAGDPEVVKAFEAVIEAEQAFPTK